MEEKQVRIILLSDARLMRARQVKELKMYIEKKEKLELRLTMLRSELRLTDEIIKMIEKETVTNPITDYNRSK
jgi:hypothetical protein